MKGKTPMKKSLILVLVFALTLAAFAGCTAKPTEDNSTGLSPEEQSALYAEALALSVSLINIKAYGIVLVKPAEGRENVVKTGLQSFIDNQKQSFDHYLSDQYAIAESARLETLKDGSLLMVMAPNVDMVFEAISATL